MAAPSDLVLEAKAIPFQERLELLRAIPETEIHQHFAALFQAMEPQALVEVTHGPDEYGKDIVIVREHEIAPDTIAVVVKRGDIRGKTAGDVDGVIESVQERLDRGSRHRLDEILSQARQARDHPAELRSVLADLPITKVIVVLIGETSGNARKRIQREVKEVSDVFDVKWAVSHFTTHYPQVFFDPLVIDFLYEATTRLEHDHFLSKSGKTLSECFVAPAVAALDVPLGLDESLALRLSKRRMPFAQLEQLLRRRSCTLLVGDPGSGKSGALAKIAIDMYREAHQQARRGEEDNIALPILVSATQLHECRNAEGLLDALIPAALRSRFSPQVLLVDGLDELPGPLRKETLERSKQVADDLECSLVVTTRRLGFVYQPVEGFDKYELLPFAFGQALELVKRLAGDSGVLPPLKSALERLQTQIPLSPLSLRLLVDLAEENSELPASVAELYERFFDMVLGRWDREKGLAVLFEYVVKKRFLASFATNLLWKHERLSTSLEDFDAFLSQYAQEYGWDAAKLRDFVGELERAGILSNDGNEISFRHRSFVEYFVASHLQENRDDYQPFDELVTGLYFDDMWSEVVLFVTGIERKVRPGVLEKIFGTPSNDITTAMQKLLVGRVLQAGWHTATAVKQAALQQALGYAPDVRSKFEQFAESAEVAIPKSVADFVTLILCDISFGSRFLANEGIEVAEEILRSGDKDAPFMVAALFWAQHRLFDPDRKRKLVDDTLAELGRAAAKKKIGVSEQTRVLSLLALAQSEDRRVSSAILRKLKRLARRAPKLVRKLLPGGSE